MPRSPAPPFDHPASGATRSGSPRFIGIDVARAVALIGVVLMNYHGEMNFPRESTLPVHPLIERVFDVYTGALSTRFAATFVVIAGIGFTFMTNPARQSTSHPVIGDTRIRVARRGFVLLITGYFLDLAWPGTILFFYGAYFLLGTYLFRLRSRHLAMIGTWVVGLAFAISVWRYNRSLDGRSTAWVNPTSIESMRDFLLRIFVGYTHPVLPWLAFFITGMVLGRHFRWVMKHWSRVCRFSALLTISAYGLATSIRHFDVESNPWLFILSSMQPNQRGPLYVMSSIGIATLAVVGISFVSTRTPTSPVVIALQRAGQMSLSSYLFHVLFYFAVVTWSGWVAPHGLTTAIVLASVYWTLAIVLGSWWHHRIGPGPAERIYRFLGG